MKHTKPSKRQKDKIKNVYLAPLNNLWQIIRTMPPEDRKALISHVLKLNDKNCSWIEYASKEMLLKLLEHSECYYNGLGYTTPIPEIEAARDKEESDKLLTIFVN